MAECAANYTVYLTLKVPAELARSIGKHAEQLGVSKSAVCRMLLGTGSVPKLSTQLDQAIASLHPRPEASD